MSHLPKSLTDKNKFLWMIAWLICGYSIALLLNALSGYITCTSNPLDDRCSSFSTIDIVIIVVSMGFSLAGLACTFLKRPGIETLFFLIGSCAISSGLLNSLNPDFRTRLFYFHLAILTPIMLHFYLSLLLRPLRRPELFSLWMSYFLGIGLAAPFLLFSVTSLKHIGIYAFYANGVRVLLFTTVLWILILLGYAYQHFSTLSSRRRIRLLCLGSAFAFAPLLLLTLLPQSIGGEFASPALTFPWLLLIPLIHLYSSFRARLDISERFYSKVLVFYLLFTLILSIQAILLSLIKKMIPANAAQLEVEALILIFLIFLFVPLRRSFTHLVNWFFYGDETDYTVALRHLEKTLVNVLDLQRLIDLLLVELVQTTKVRRAILFLKQNQRIVFAHSNGIEAHQLCDIRLAPDGPLCAYLSTLKAPIDTLRLRRDLSRKNLSEQETLLFQLPEIALWLPFVVEEDLQGLLLLDTRVDDDLFTQADKELLTDLIDHGGNAIRNVLMAENLRVGQRKLAKAHQASLESQEQERKRIARELHDDTVQKLLGVSYQVTKLKKKVVPFTQSDNSSDINGDLDLIQKELLDTTTCIREMIGELRPVGLDELGLPVALEAYVDKQREVLGGGPILERNIDHQLSWLPEPLSICIFRVAQEAIRNSIQHAAASIIFVDLYATTDKLILKVMDDGQGFLVPDRFSEFSYSGHYGLMGMLERAQYFDGTLTISSDPGNGTAIEAVFPIQGDRHVLK